MPAKIYKVTLTTEERTELTAFVSRGKGYILDHEYSIGEGRDKVVQVSKKGFRVWNSYGVEIEPGQDDIVILATTVCIDQIAH